MPDLILFLITVSLSCAWTGFCLSRAQDWGLNQNQPK
jgi:hypothetical protein